MVDSLLFRLPDTSLTVRPVLNISRAVRDKDYILSATFDGSGVPVERDTVPVGLQWSTTLKCPFVYLPASEGPGAVRLDEFEVPAGTTSLAFRVRPWGSATPNQSSPYSDVVLETTLLGRTALILGKEN